MKKGIVLILVCLLATVMTVAQDMKVIDFRLLETDLTANVHGTQKTDNNGETAALIKIQTPERGFIFDGGMTGIVATEEHAGEIWVYVPRRAQKLIIQHKDYGVLRDFFYPVPIEGGKTYEMLIDIGTGRYVTVTSQVAKADIYIDGELCGQSPVRKYLNYGRHQIRATKDRFEGETTATITTNEDEGTRLVQVDMLDMSSHYGDVAVTVDNRADIYFNGQNVGNGSWNTQLREGNYTVETRKADCDPMMTSFTVTARQQNTVKANAPVPHTGWLSIYTRPGNVKTTYNGSHFIDLSETVSVPVGTYQMEFSRNRYVTQKKDYTVNRNETVIDTVTLKRVEYVKSKCFYFGGGFTVRSMAGISGILGVVFLRHDLQAFYTFGLSASDPINCYNSEDNYLSTISFKKSSFGLKYGYQFNLMEQIGLTPQIGVSVDRLTGTVKQGTNLYADGASATCATVGVKLVYAPFQHFYLFAAPEYAIAVQKDDNYTRLTEAGDITAGGFAATVGVIVNF